MLEPGRLMAGADVSSMLEEPFPCGNALYSAVKH